jgi:hypothetical protein
MLLRRAVPDYQAPFELLDFTVISEKRGDRRLLRRRRSSCGSAEKSCTRPAEGDGPVNALISTA